MEFVQFALLLAGFGLWNLCTAYADLLKEQAFEHRIVNDEWREKNGYTRGLLGGWKRPKDRKK